MSGEELKKILSETNENLAVIAGKLNITRQAFDQRLKAKDLGINFVMKVAAAVNKTIYDFIEHGNKNVASNENIPDSNKEISRNEDLTDPEVKAALLENIKLAQVRTENDKIRNYADKIRAESERLQSETINRLTAELCKNNSATTNSAVDEEFGQIARSIHFLREFCIDQFSTIQHRDRADLRKEYDNVVISVSQSNDQTDN